MDEKYNALIEAILDGDEEEGVSAAQELVSTGTEPVKIFSECIQNTLNDLGEKFGRLEVFLPDLIMASDVVKAVQADLLPIMQSDTENSVTIGRAVIGTAFGDLHDIGKNMVSLMLQVNGFEVKDLGVNVESAAFLTAAKDFDADLILMSGLMLPSLPYMQDTIDRVKADAALSKKYKIMVGGGPVTLEWAEHAGADGYSDDAMDAVKKAKEMMDILKAAQ